MKEVVRRDSGREALLNSGVRAAFAVSGGFGLLLLRSLTAFGAISIPGLVVGGALGVFGLGTAAGSAERSDRLGGGVTFLAGAATVAASLPVVGGAANAVMWVAGLAFVGYGIVTLTRFLSGVRSRK